MDNLSTRGFIGLCCPRCGEEGGVMTFLTDTSNYKCDYCGESFHRESVERIGHWHDVLTWCATAPRALPVDDGDVDLGGAR
jgi:hypothetical protein